MWLNTKICHQIEKDQLTIYKDFEAYISSVSPSLLTKYDRVNSVLLKQGSRPLPQAAMFKFLLDLRWVKQLKGFSIFCKRELGNRVYEIFLVWQCMKVIERRISECYGLIYEVFCVFSFFFFLVSN